MAKKEAAKEASANVCGPGCCGNICGKCMACKYLVLGVLIVLNAVYAWFGWGVFVGGIIALKGLLMLAKPMGCGHCK